MHLHRIWIFTAVVCIARLPATGQQDREKYRRESIESILRIQDLRTPHNERLIALLDDDDPVVRERATLACGSLQDTNLLPLLVRNLTEGDPPVQRAAAFAVGQTGTQLSMTGCQRLEYDLIWKRLDQTVVAERLIEEIGKFGTGEGLRDIMVKVGNVPPFRFRRGVTMCLARYAIRGIVTDDGVRYLLQFIRPPDQTSWETAYALQRIGSHPMIIADVEALLLLERSPDPLVRMNLATLLGKLRDEKTTFVPLCRLADFDWDWRVRVNALRALSLFPLGSNDAALAIFRKAFYDANDHVALAALAAIASTGLNVRDTTEVVADILFRLRSIAGNRDHDLGWQMQGAAAMSLSRLVGATALPLVIPTSWPEPRLQAQLLAAVALTGADGAGGVILPWVSAEQPIVASAALEALRTLTERRPSDTLLRRQACESASTGLFSSDVSAVTTSASMLGDSLFRTSASVPALIRRLGSLRAPDDVEAMQEIITTLGKLRDRQAIAILVEELHGSDRSVALASNEALQRITGVDYSGSLRTWYQPVLTDFDFDFLRSLPPDIPVLLETSKGDVLLDSIVMRPRSPS